MTNPYVGGNNLRNLVEKNKQGRNKVQGHYLTEERVEKDYFLTFELQMALARATEAMEEMLHYVPQYFQDKWNYRADIDYAKAALETYERVQSS